MPQEELNSQGKNIDDKGQVKQQEQPATSAVEEKIKSKGDIDELESCFKTALERSINLDVVLRDLFIILSQENTEYLLSDLTGRQS